MLELMLNGARVDQVSTLGIAVSTAVYNAGVGEETARLLLAGGAGTETEIAETRLAIRREFDPQLQKRATSFLERVLTPRCDGCKRSPPEVKLKACTGCTTGIAYCGKTVSVELHCVSSHRPTTPRHATPRHTIHSASVRSVHGAGTGPCVGTVRAPRRTPRERQQQQWCVHALEWQVQ